MQQCFVGNRVNNLTHQTIWISDRSISNLVENTFLACNLFEFLNIHVFNAPLSACPNSMHNLNQQINQAIRDFLAALPAKCSQQRQANRLRMSTKQTGCFGSCAMAVHTNHFGREMMKEIGG